MAYLKPPAAFPTAYPITAPLTTIVTLNVGGRLFSTTLATLCSKGQTILTLLVARDLDNIVPAPKDGAGNYFIDRNHKLFLHVLDYLRTGELDLDLFDRLTRRGVERELAHFAIPKPGPKPDAASGTEFDDKILAQLRSIPPHKETEKWLGKNMATLTEAMKYAAAQGGFYVLKLTPTAKELVPNPKVPQLYKFEPLPSLHGLIHALYRRYGIYASYLTTAPTATSPPMIDVTFRWLQDPRDLPIDLRTLLDPESHYDCPY